MIDYHKFILPNGLRVLFHKDESTPMAVVNTLYDAGARDEHPDLTGLAHLFEHLMFSGSSHVENFDQALQRVGGQSNAFTSNDVTNYYINLPKNQIETALWVESDRMTQLALTDKNLETQRQVVIEEFKQRYLNQPYGDTWMELRPLAFEKHPYRWATIGKCVEHVERVTRTDALDFYHKFYKPNNAILSIAGNFETPEVEDLVNGWFGDLPMGIENARNLPVEPKQNDYRCRVIQRDVPATAFYFAFKMGGRNSSSYPIVDLISDVLGRGKSSLLYQRYFEEKQWVSEISAFVLGSMEPGLLVVAGKLHDPQRMSAFEHDLWGFLEAINESGLEQRMLDKVRNKFLTSKMFEELSLNSRAMNLAYFELLGDTALINQETARYNEVTLHNVQSVMRELLKPEQCSVLIINPLTHV
jgi:predicted Zn-dependent peptidase